MLPDLTARPRWYVLDGHTPRPAASVIAWAEWFSRHPRAGWVASSTVGQLTLTTRFTGIDRALTESGAPLLFETVAHGDGRSAPMAVATTWAQAEAGHAAVLRTLQRELLPRSPLVNQARGRPVWLAVCRALMRRAAPFSSPTPEETSSCPSDS